VIAAYSTLPSAPPAVGSPRPALTGNVEQVGWMLYTDYLIPFELASILLLVAMIGAIVLAKREL
jgi:NADH-quinone oxidoreductase subunit J